MVAAWFGGLRGGLLATVLASLLMDYFFFEPVRSLFSFSHREDVLRLGVFVLVTVLISLLNAARRRGPAPRPPRPPPPPPPPPPPRLPPPPVCLPRGPPRTET